MTTSDRPELTTGARTGAAAGKTPHPDPTHESPAGDTDWHSRDAAANYGLAIATLRAALVASGKARL